jgi:hypothetical protein
MRAPSASSVEPNRSTVDVSGGSPDWRVVIKDVSGAVVSERVCGDEREAHNYASTVRQHIHWLSEAKLREYYRLP